MNKRPSSMVAFVFAVVLIAAGCGHGSGAEPAHEEASASHAQIRREDDGSILLTIDESAREHLAIRAEAAAAASLTPQVDGYARVLDPTPFIEAITEERGAAASVEAAEKELARNRQLAADQNVSARSAEASVAALAQARATLDAVRARLLIGWGSALAAEHDTHDVVAALLARRAAMIRVDLPSHRTLQPRAVQLAFADTPGEMIRAELLGAAPDIDPKLQGQSFLALVSPNAAGLVPGQQLLAFLELEGAPVAAVLVPRAAIVRTGSSAWVYVVDDGAGTFRRRELQLDRAAPEGWIATGSVHAGDRLVVEGAQQLLSEEALATGDVRVD